MDRLHDAGGSIAAHLDMSSARRPGAVVRRVNVDFPEWMVAELDREAEHLGVTRQSVIKVFIAERLKAARSA
ncbi:MAG: CopG family transcriptional regulator [Proteobacteria bacterium]|nr:CopG family transcriptional regulator [Pseudomonadota bacterium]